MQDSLSSELELSLDLLVFHAIGQRAVDYSPEDAWRSAMRRRYKPDF
jgi:hypothetical protein